MPTSQSLRVGEQQGSLTSSNSLGATTLEETRTDHYVARRRHSHQSYFRGGGQEPSARRRGLWAALLTQRPGQDNNYAMRKWLDKIHAVSNAKIPDDELGLSEASSSD